MEWEWGLRGPLDAETRVCVLEGWVCICSDFPSVRRREPWAVNLSGAMNRFPRNLPIPN